MEFHKQVKSNFQTVETVAGVGNGHEIKLLARSVNGGWISYVFYHRGPTGARKYGADDRTG